MASVIDMQILCEYIKESTLVKSPLNANNVASAIDMQLLCKFIEESTLVGSLMSANNVASDLT